LTSANEKVSRFLRDPAQSELRLLHYTYILVTGMYYSNHLYFRLHPMPKNEQDQLSHLAEMYSLHMQLNDSPKKGVTLTKTE
jgi:G patch domain-containing protein 2